MTKSSILRIAMTLCFLGFIATFHAYLNPATAQTCDTAKDAKLVSDIYADIKADKALASQVSHINVVANCSAVRLQGWANNKNDYDKVHQIALNTGGVRVVNVNLFSETPPEATSTLRSSGGCQSGTKPCGDVCIPEGDSCNITP